MSGVTTSILVLSSSQLPGAIMMNEIVPFGIIISITQNVIGSK